MKHELVFQKYSHLLKHTCFLRAPRRNTHKRVPRDQLEAFVPWQLTLTVSHSKALNENPAATLASPETVLCLIRCRASSDAGHNELCRALPFLAGSIFFFFPKLGGKRAESREGAFQRPIVPGEGTVARATLALLP